MSAGFPQIFLFVGVVWGAIALLLFFVAWAAIIKGREGLHRAIMKVLVALGWAFVIFYLGGRALAAERIGVPVELLPWIATHGTVAVISLLFLTVLLWARLTDRGPSDGSSFRRRLNSGHRRYGTVAAILWIFSNAAGIFNAYLLTYIYGYFISF